MRGIFSKGFFKCGALSSAPNGCARKRETAFPLPQVKRQKVHGPVFPQQALGVFEGDYGGEEDAVDQGVQVEQSAGVGDAKLTVAEPKHVDVEEKSCVYPSVVYEGDVATVKLGVGQVVGLDGCAMVQVVEGQAAMLGYSLPRCTDILVCSSSKLAEVIIIAARHGLRDGRPGGTEVEDATVRGGEESKILRETLGCQLRFSSHNLGQQRLASEEGLSFRLEVGGPLGSSLGQKRGWHVLEQHNQDQGSPDYSSGGDELSLDSEARFSDNVEDRDERDAQSLVRVDDVELDGHTDNVNKRKGYGQNADSVKRQRVVEMLDSYSSATSVPHDWKEAVENITLGSGAPVVGIAVQRMLESLRLLGS